MSLRLSPNTSHRVMGCRTQTDLADPFLGVRNAFISG